MFVWTSASDVLIGSGYWSADSADGGQANGWAGANAPHFVHERSDARGSTRLLGSARSTSVEFVDMERIAANGDRIRRQVMHLRPDVWIAIDRGLSAHDDSFVVDWMFNPSLELQRSGDTTVRVGDRQRGIADVTLSGCARGDWRIVRGSTAPFGGWAVIDDHVKPAPTIVRRCPANDVAAFVLTTSATPSEGVPAQPLVVTMKDSENWQLSADTNDEPLVSRNGNEIHVASSKCQSPCASITIVDTAQSDEATQQINRSYFDLSQKYVRYKESWLGYRVKMTRLILVGWAGFLVLLLVSATVLRRNRRNVVAYLCVAALGCWVVAAAWLGWVYFA